MKRRHTCQESETKWKQLLTLSKKLDGSNTLSTNKGSGGSNGNDKNDLYDCQSMVTPTTRALVDDVLEEFAAKWRALDDRRITQDPSIMAAKTMMDLAKTNNDDKTLMPPPPKRKYRRGGWEHTQEQLLTLPPNFDYATERDSPPSPTLYDQHDKVIDLMNPTQQYPYHQELWKLFQKIPTVEELTENARANAQLPNTLQLHQEIAEGTQKVQRMDAHGLCRMRMSNRHGLPPIESTSNNDNNYNLVGTIRLEFWRRQPKRGSGADARRMVLEFGSHQTLLDVHKAIVGMTEDDGWAAQTDTTDGGLFFIEEVFYTTNGQEEASITGQSASANASEEASNTRTTADNATTTTTANANSSGTAATASGRNNNTTAPATSNDTGMDYMTAITTWLDGGGIPNPARRHYLGIATQNRFRRGTNMKDAILGHIPFRLGVRYYHVMHGDVECSIMVTDKRLIPDNPNTKYPIIHDIWMPNYPVPICEACDRFAAVYVYFHRGTAAENHQDGEPTALCDNCVKALKLLEKEKDALQLYHVWKNKSELSTAMVRSEQCRFF